MKVALAAAVGPCALSTISLPNSELNGRRNHAAGGGDDLAVLLPDLHRPFDKMQLEDADLALAVGFHLGVAQLEQAVEDPDPGAELLVDPYELAADALSRGFRRLEELAVLRQR